MGMSVLSPRLLSRILALFIAMTLVGMAVAEGLVPLKLRYHRLTLSNGRVLKDVMINGLNREAGLIYVCLLYTSPSPRDRG